MAICPAGRVLTRLDTRTVNGFPHGRGQAMIRAMKTILKTLLFAPALALAAEQLPDAAPPDDETPRTREKSPAQPLNGQEMESLYLQSPVELDTSDESRGLNAVSPDTRYLENEQQELRQRQAESLRPPPVQDDTPPPPPPTLMPIRDL